MLLDEVRYRKVTRKAERSGVSVAAVIRAAIDRLPTDDEKRRAAIDEILVAEPMAVPADPADMRRELDEAHSHADP